MRRSASHRSILALGGLALVTGLLSGCGGSGTRTVSVADTQTTTSATASRTTSAHHTATATATATATPGTSGPSGSGPAFAPGGASSGAADAATLLGQHGYVPLRSGDYVPTQTLRVLIGQRPGTPHVQQAFFFVNGRFIGTDTSLPSASIRVVAQSDTAVTLAYALYHPGDHACCASAGEAQVQYRLDNGHLSPLGAIPPPEAAADPGRR